MSFSLAQILLGEKDYPAIGNFFRKTRGAVPQEADPQVAYAYRVYISRRCYNLNEIFFAQELETYKKQGDSAAADRLIELRETTFLNQYGLMCRAGELAARYEADGHRFPRLLIVDELAIYGREIARLLEKMASLLVDAYAEQFGGKPVDEQSRLVRAFYAAADVRIYGKNEKPLLLPKELNDRICFEEEMPAARWRSFIRNISALVAHTDGIRNKSFYPLFCIQKGSLKLPYKKRSYPYHGNELKIYQGRRGGVRFAFCVRDTGSVSELLSVPLWDGLPREQAAQLLHALTEILSEGGLLHIAAVLRSTSLGALQVQFQLISFLLAVFSFLDIAEASEIDLSGENAYTADFDRCAMNFGAICEIEPEMRALTAPENAKLRDELKKQLHNAFQITDQGEAEPEASPDSTEQLLSSTESYFAEISDRDGRAVFAMREMGLTFDALTRDYDIVPMREYLSDARIPGDEADHTYSMLLLIEDGQISTNVQLNDGEVQLRLKAGECAKFIWPERLDRFLPALSALELWSERSGFSPERKFREFGKYLEQQEPQYAGLSQKFEAFLKAQYACGDKVRDWRIDFLRGINVPDTVNKKWISDPWSGRPWSADEVKAYRNRKQSYWEWQWNCQEKIIAYLKRYVALYAY